MARGSRQAGQFHIDIWDIFLQLTPPDGRQGIQVMCELLGLCVRVPSKDFTIHETNNYRVLHACSECEEDQR
ncbi:MAG: hypothetical protein RIQ52_2059 [Pseudomonadota bacterium]|jgi:hypothetical protein